MFERVTRAAGKSEAPQTRAPLHVSRALPAGTRVQPKLEVGRADDPLEHEADRIADAVMASGPTTPDVDPSASADGTVQRKCAACEDESSMVRGKDAAPGPVGADAARAIASGSGGRSLSAQERSFFEPRFGHRFDQVRVHDDRDAARLSADLGARAFTHGQNVYFGAGQYRTGDDTSQRLLAHELTHTLQQGG